MRPDVGKAMREGTILTGSWYPVDFYADAYRAFLAARGDGVKLAHKMGYLTAKVDMAKLHNRLISSFVSPQTLFKFAAAVFNSYYDVASFKVLEASKGYVKAKITRGFGFDGNIWTDIVGSSVAMLAVA